jgi:hypothetical protein
VIQNKVIQGKIIQEIQRECPNELHEMDQGVVRGSAVKRDRHKPSLVSISGVILNFNNEIAIQIKQFRDYE